MKTDEPQILVCTRLNEMTQMHPEQDDTHVCNRCGYPVGIYPSGQRVLKKWPNLEISCLACAMKTHRPGDINLPAAETPEEFIAEHRASKPVVQH